MKLDSGFRFPCVTVKKIKIEVKSTSSPDQKVKAQNSFIHAGFQNHKGSNPTSEMSKISFSCGLDKMEVPPYPGGIFVLRLRGRDDKCAARESILSYQKRTLTLYQD